MGTFSFVVLLLGFTAVLYWYFINEHYSDKNGSTGFLGVITDLDNKHKFAIKSLFSKKTSKLLYEKNKPNDDILKRRQNKKPFQNNYDRNDPKNQKLEGQENSDKEKKEKQGREDIKKRNLNSRFYRYTDNNIAMRYKIIPRLVRKEKNKDGTRKTQKNKKRIM